MYLHVFNMLCRQSGDIHTPGIRAFGHPGNDVDKRAFKSPIGGHDCFRFSYIGLGKRSGKELIEVQGLNQHALAINKYLNNNHRPASLADVWKISKQKGPGLTNDHLTHTMVYRRMMRNTYDKRDPELFTEDLYQIQSGRQQFETYMDSALDQMHTWDEEMSQHGDIVDEISALEMAKQLNNDTHDTVITDSVLTVEDKPPTSEIKYQSFDLSFSPPDINLSSYSLDNDGDSIDKAEAKSDTKKNGDGLQTDLTSSDYRSQVNGHLVVDTSDMLTLSIILLVLGESNFVVF